MKDHKTQTSNIPQEMRDAWSRTCEILRQTIRPQYFTNFFDGISLVDSKGSTLVLGFPGRFQRDWVCEHYSTLVQDIFSRESSGQFSIEYSQRFFPRESARSSTLPPMGADDSSLVSEVFAASPVPASSYSAPKSIPSQKKAPSLLSTKTHLNPRYTFETFVVGSSNQFAHAAAFTVSETPGKQYNPLFIYGDVGLGKTHLLNAIGLKIQEKFPGQRVHYTTSEKFTNHMIESMRFEKMDEFRERYRKHVDVLIIDDIQFIAGKEKTQEEFFHTFCELYDFNKQIVLSSDRTPREMEKLEDRLRSRFEMGLIVDIQPPEMETRVAIIHQKAELFGMEISQDVSFYLAQSFQNNVREIEGALNRLQAYSSLSGQPITVDVVRNILRPDSLDIIKAHQDPEEILRTVSRHYNTTVDDLRSARKTRDLAMPRQLAMYLTREFTSLSFPDIGTLFGGRNHATVIHACRQVDKLKKSDPFFKETLLKIEREIRKDTTQNYSPSVESNF